MIALFHKLSMSYCAHTATVASSFCPPHILQIDGSGKIPARFENPDSFKGYGQQAQNPLYTTTSGTYGCGRDVMHGRVSSHPRSLPPSVHTVPTQFHAKDGHFTRHQVR